ncbi:o-succinylbenzoate synthase [Lysinibacter sp. HNR]|uniref:o-succinylbenzoate synthase n=1 Tax=Lysinibacter sp. HNR TaxID=3031408 RepID=UPI0024354E6C|nr:o-succinylbenzoate synthase [Lysinibacter sp. HNR]WGD37798.1 o-succinylbenzoate synthase [Lysinibacter sp. HNR]
MRATRNDILDSLRVVAIPTRTRFRGISVREAALWQGPEGWTEFSPFPEYRDEEAAQWLSAAIEFGHEQTPPILRSAINVNATVPAIAAHEIAGVLDRFPGCNTAKVKVAEENQTLRDDMERVRAVREYLGEDGKIRVDANGGWSVKEAEEALLALLPYGLEYAEQPCATVAELTILRQRLAHSRVLIAADESVRKAQDPIEVARQGAADIVVIKAQPLGGIRSALSISDAAGLPTVVSSALDTSVGLSMGLHLAGALPAQPFAAGLGTAALLGGDVTEAPLLPVNGQIEVRRVTPSESLLSRYAAPSDRTRWWEERITRCYKHLEDKI